MEHVVQLERCILRAESLDGYKIVLEKGGEMNEESPFFLQIIMQKYSELYLGQTIPSSHDCPASFTVVDLTPATAGILSEATTLIVLPPDTCEDKSHIPKINNLPLEKETNYKINKENIVDTYDLDTCIILMDESLSGSNAIGSKSFFMRTLLIDGAVVCAGDEEYMTAFTITKQEENEGEKNCMENNNNNNNNLENKELPTLRTAPDVFRNIRACFFLETQPIFRKSNISPSSRSFIVDISFFTAAINELGDPITLRSVNFAKDLKLNSLSFVPAWPLFMMSALFGEIQEEFLSLALHAGKDQLNGRIISEGDVISIRITPRLFMDNQLSFNDATEAILSHISHLVQGGHASTARAILLHDNAITIPLRVIDVIANSKKTYGILEICEGGTDVLLSMRTSLEYEDSTPLFPPLLPYKNFLSKLSLTKNIRNALEVQDSKKSHNSIDTHVFVIHATKDNLPYECIATILASIGLDGLIVDLDRWNDDEMEKLLKEYMLNIGGIALIVKNAQQLPDRPQILSLFDIEESRKEFSFSLRIIFLVCECVEAPPPTVAARAHNMEGVLKGTNPSDEDRQIILESIFIEAHRTSGICKSLLLSFESVASWTVGLSAADVIAYMQECLSFLNSMQLPFGVFPVLSESLCGDILQKFQKAHGHNLVSTKLQPVRWSDVGGLEEAKRELREMIQLPLLHPELFQNSSTKRRAGILFYGPPGCGKTLLAKAVATEMNMNFMAVKGPELINQYVGESEKNIRLLFQRARDNSPCIIFFDELDALAPARGAKGDAGGAMDRVVAQLLVEVDGVGHARSDGTAAAQVFIIGATNRPDLLDPSLLRPGRFDRLCYLGIPASREEQLVALRALTRKFELASDVNFKTLLEPLSLEYTGADLFALCSDAMMFAVEEMLEDAVKAQKKEEENANANIEEGIKNNNGKIEEPNCEETAPKLVVCMRHFVQARGQLKPSVTADDLRRYEALRTKFSTR